MKFLIKLDEGVLALIERFCHWFQVQTGKTNYFLAKVAAGILLGTVCIELGLKVSNAGLFKPIWVIDYLAAIFFLYLIIWFFSAQEYGFIRRIVEGFGNPLKGSMLARMSRVLGLISMTSYELGKGAHWLVQKYIYDDGVPIRGFDWHLELHVWTYLILLYLIACDPLPPCNGKISNWLGSLFGKPQINQ